MILASLAIGLVMASRVEHNPKGRSVARGFQLIDELALDQPPDDELVAAAMRGMVGVLRRRGDAHSDYLDPIRAEPLRDEMRQQFGGVGVMIKIVETGPGGLLVAEPPEPGGPAHVAGVQDGDRIVEIQGRSTQGITLAEALDQLRGKPGDPVELLIARLPKSDSAAQAAANLPAAYQELLITITRQVIRLPAFKGDRRRAEGAWEFRLAQRPEIAHVRFAIFGNRTVEELRDLLDRLTQAGVKQVVLDLRDNAGGALDAAIGVADMLLPAEAPIVSTRGRDGEVLDTYKSSSSENFPELDLVVLIDRDTASAAEIVAAALADNGRAILVGERSFGKATVQQLLPLSSGQGLLKLTTLSYWRPSGANIHRHVDAPESDPWGVWPDPAGRVELTDEQLASFREWRRRRDLLPIDDDALPEDGTPPEASPLTADAALARAVELLQKAE
ncbi:S41 family peptidase [Botrimarina hoheduenensis]|uniref:S41 family peptidase n=1 Tax=Botrimarina hoheduenensis TaxID=2528000 RepID=UPI0018D322CE|nr:S41 family peptidase [Botrimarina hoheduenensis]